MNLLLNSQFTIHNSQLNLTGSKSETNRLLLLQALYPNITLENASNSDDSDVMDKALNSQFTISSAQFVSDSGNNSPLINVYHAGTAMRFLTAFFAIQENVEVVLTGSNRMKERPIKILVDALQVLGAIIEYQENEGFPPIKIIGKKITKNKVSLAANVSSQYISALLLIAPKLENGLELTLAGEITSLPYIKMTLALLNEIGIGTSFEDSVISINHKSKIVDHKSKIESDWSSASYFYSIIALSEIGTEITLSTFKKNSLQGDAVLVEIYNNFGVTTSFNENESITLTKSEIHKVQTLSLDLKNCPDLAQTIVLTCFGLKIGCVLTGLHTLKIKETDRLEALKYELTKLGASIAVTDESLTLIASNEIYKNVTIATYQDHRMAMAFAPLALKTPIIIENAEVISKSYPGFWTDLKTIGVQITEI